MYEVTTRLSLTHWQLPLQYEHTLILRPAITAQNRTILETRDFVRRPDNVRQLYSNLYRLSQFNYPECSHGFCGSICLHNSRKLSEDWNLEGCERSMHGGDLGRRRFSPFLNAINKTWFFI